MNNQKVKITGPDEGKTVSVVGDTNRILLTGESNNGTLACIDVLIPPGGGPIPHSHPGFHEYFYVIEGELTVRAERQEPYLARKGAFVEIPKGGIIHQFKNESEAVTHILIMVTPPGLDKFFNEIGKPVKWGEFLPVIEPSAEEKENLKNIAERYDQRLFPPDYLLKTGHQNAK